LKNDNVEAIKIWEIGKEIGVTISGEEDGIL